MKREYDAIDSGRKRNATEATIIVRGDEDSMAGLVQDVVLGCQLAKFQNLVLRAEESKSWKFETSTGAKAKKSNCR